MSKELLLSQGYDWKTVSQSSVGKCSQIVLFSLPKSSEEGMVALAVHGRLQGGGGVSSNLEDG